MLVPTDVRRCTVGVLGGTGPQGAGLAARLAAAGISVLIGSRNAERAAEVAGRVSERSGCNVLGVDNTQCASRSDIVVVAVPWEAHASVLRELAGPLTGKILVDCVNPLGFDERGPYALPVAEGSAAQQAQALLGSSVVTGAFHHVSAVQLNDPDVTRFDGDVLVVGDERAATDLICALVDLIPGMRGVYAGRLRNAHQVEALTANILAINRRYRAHAGIRVTDV